MRPKHVFWVAIWTFVISIMSFAASPAPHTINLAEDSAIVEDDDNAASNARVARISFLDGDSQLKRLDSTEWERASLNLPLVEGDSIAVGSGSRLEIQFDTKTHLRLGENSFLRILKLKSEGIAVSISEGTGSVRLIDFDKERSYFEIDAPSTTIAVQRSGLYRVDAGMRGEDAIRISALDLGEARVYSENSGFTLKTGRTARLFIAGERLGEWDTEKASTVADLFDSWVLERDEVIARRIKESHYDTYYDRDIYAAHELTENGTWIHTRKYGYVWRPHRQATSVYADWSPYRYGTWRWVPYYGWTWINDEPWGWATYHHGRWVYIDSSWHWSPYGYYRYSRSWWRPALVVFNVFGGSYCWYPLPYNYAYYNYNYYVVNNNTTIINNVNPQPTPNPVNAAPLDGQNVAKGRRLPPIESVPVSAVVAMDVKDFGRGTRGVRAPLASAQAVLTKVPDEKQIAVKLPSVHDLDRRTPMPFQANAPASVKSAATTRTGAAIRTGDVPLDRGLRNERIFGNRPPAPVIKWPNVDTPSGGVRSTGAVDRPPSSEGIRTPPTNTRRESQPPLQQAPPSVRETPRYNPPVRQEPPPSVRETPRYNPPVRQEPPPVRQEPPRERPRDNPPPVRQEPPRPSERPRDNPPPVKQPPAAESKPDTIERGGRKP